MDLKTYIGLQIRHHRKLKGLTQEQLAERVEKAVETISNVERGHTRTGLETLERIALTLDVPLGVFFTGAEDASGLSAQRREKELQIQEIVRSLPDSYLDTAKGQLELLARHEKK